MSGCTHVLVVQCPLCVRTTPAMHADDHLAIVPRALLDRPFGFKMNDIIRTPLGVAGTVIGVK